MTFVNPYPPGGWGGVMETFVLKTKSYVLKNKYVYFGFVYVIDLAVNLGCEWRSAMLPRLKNSCSGHIVQIISPKFSPAAGLIWCAVLILFETRYGFLRVHSALEWKQRFY